MAPRFASPKGLCYNDTILATISDLIALRIAVAESQSTKQLTPVVTSLATGVLNAPPPSRAFPHLQAALCFYRLQSWNHKTGARPLAYILLAYAVADRWVWLPLLLNAAAGIGVFMFAGAFDDYWDYRLRAERNFLGTQVGGGVLSAPAALGLACVPLCLTLPLLAFAPSLGLPRHALAAILAGSLVLLLAYSLPPLRLKERAPWGCFVGPSLAALLFLASWRVTRPLTLPALILASLLFGFQCYAEAMHILDNTLTHARPMARLASGQAIQWFRRLPLLLALGSLAAALFSPVFLVSVCCGLVRWIAARRLAMDQIGAVRARLWSPSWALYEFLAYGGLGLLGAFGR